QVHGLGGAVAGAVGGVEGEELVGPAVDGRGEPDQLGHIGLRAPLEGRDQASAGVVDVDSAEHGPQELLGQQGGADLAPAVASVEATLQSSPARFVEVLAGHEQQPADPVERVALAATMPEGLLLGAAAHVIDGLVGEAHEVGPVEPPRGVKAAGDAGGGAPSESVTTLPERPMATSSSGRRSRSTRPVTYAVARFRLRARNRVSSTPSEDTPVVRAGSLINGVPWSTTAAHAQCQPTPKA